MGVISMGKDVFTSIGSVSKKIAIELGQDQQLCRLLKDTSINPLDKNKADWDYISNPLLHKNILIVPKVDISELNIGDAVHVSDIHEKGNFVIENEDDDALVIVRAPTDEPEEDAEEVDETEVEATEQKDEEPEDEE